MSVWNYEPQMRNAGVFPKILAIGDSWFWYPENNLLNPINQYCAGSDTLCLGANGAEAKQLAGARYRTYFRDALKGYPSIDVVLISAGGNDFAGLDDFASLLHPDCSKCEQPEQCFLDGEPDDLFDAVLTAYRTLISDVLELRPKAKILLHSYDYAIPDGRTFHGLSGQWLKIPMNNCRVPGADELAPGSFRRQLVKLLIDDLTHRLTELSVQYSGRVLVVKTPGTLCDNDWSNELHPSAEGFDRLAKTKFCPVI